MGSVRSNWHAKPFGADSSPGMTVDGLAPNGASLATQSASIADFLVYFRASLIYSDGRKGADGSAGAAFRALKCETPRLVDFR